MAYFQRLANALFIWVLCGVLLSSDFYQFIEHAKPCPLCLLQRLGIFGITIALLLNLRFGIKTEHYGLGLLSAVVGSIVSLKQISLNICQPVAIGVPILGFKLYVWAFVVYICSITAIAFLMMFFGWTNHEKQPPAWCAMEKFSFILVVLVLLVNLATLFTGRSLSSLLTI